MVSLRIVHALLLAAVLAGCSEGGGAGDGGASDDALPRLAASSTTGVIRGVVVDDAIRPLANAVVAARAGGFDRNVTTGPDGFFGFSGLPPGTYFVTAQKSAYQEVQQSVEVAAGVDEPPVVKLQLTFIPGEEPFLIELKVEAFVQCIIPGANMCAIINLYPCALAGLCDPIVDDTSYVLLYDEIVALQRTPDWLQTELVWESTQAVSPKLAIRPSAHSPDDGAGLDERQDWIYGGSPIVWSLDKERAEEWETGKAEGVSFEIFGHMDETSAIGSIGFVVNQQVSFFFHVFYGYTPPEGWQFSVDGAYPPPV